MEVEAAVPAPQPAVSPPEASPAKKALAAAPTSALKTRAARRKTLCDITNLRRREPAEVPDESACPAAADVERFAQLVKENADLMSLIAERDEIIQLSGTEIQKLRLANWELARANAQMMAELNLGRKKLKALQHELACSTAALKVKTSELEDAKKVMLRRNIHSQKTQHLQPDRAAPTKDGDVVDPEPATSIQMSGNVSRKRMLRSRSLGPAASTKLALPKDKETSQRRKSMRMPSARSEDLFEIEDVQLAIGSCKIDADSASGSERPGHQFLHRSSLGRPLRQARERVTSYKEMPLHVKLRRP